MRCLNRAHRKELVFGNLSPEASRDLSAIARTTFYPGGTRLFAHQTEVPGIFIIGSGKVNLFVSFGQTHTVNFGVAGPGDILGLTATMSNLAYHAVAEVLEPSEIKFIPRSEFLEFLARRGKVAVRVAEQLCATYNAALSEMAAIGFSSTAAHRFARFLLQQSVENDAGQDEVRIKLTLTPQQMAQIVGVRRETFSRIFNDFKRKKLLAVRGATIILHSRAALGLIVSGLGPPDHSR